MSVQVTNTGQMSLQRVLPLEVITPRHGADREGGGGLLEEWFTFVGEHDGLAIGVAHWEMRQKYCRILFLRCIGPLCR